MPSVQKSDAWYIRITAPWEHIKSKCSGNMNRVDFSGSFIAYHIGEKTKKPHAHIALVLTSFLQKQSIDVWAKSLFGVKGSDYSNKPWDKNPQVLRYGFHDPQAEVINNLGLSEETMERLRQESKVITSAVADAKGKASNRLPDYVLDNITASGNKMTPDEIGYAMFKAVYEGKFHNPSNFQYESYINEVMIRQCTDEEELKTAWNDRRAQLRILNLKSGW